MNPQEERHVWDVFLKRHFLDYDTECGTQVGMKMEYNLGTRGGICGGRVEVERATQRKSSRNLYRIPLSPQLNTKLQMCGMKLHNYQRAVRWTAHVTCGWETFKFWPARVERTCWTHMQHSLELSERASLKGPGVLCAHKITPFQTLTTNVAFLLPLSWCFSAMCGGIIRLVVVSVVFHVQRTLVFQNEPL